MNTSTKSDEQKKAKKRVFRISIFFHFGVISRFPSIIQNKISDFLGSFLFQNIELDATFITFRHYFLEKNNQNTNIFAVFPRNALVT